MQRLKKYRYAAILLLAGALAGIAMLGFDKPDVKASPGGFNLGGWAWSETIGWISMNFENCDKDRNGISDGTPASCPAAGTTMASYGVNVDSSGNLSGWAWSSWIGWISFNLAETGSCPEAPCQAHFDRDTGEVEGFARAMAGAGPNTGGWDGWIRLAGVADDSSPYQVSVGGCSWNGWAWGDDPVGWIHFRGTTPSGAQYGVQGDTNSPACRTGALGAPTVSITANGSDAPDPIIRGETVTIEWTSADADTCTGTNFDTGDATEGSVEDTPLQTTPYAITCEGSGGVTPDSVEVQVINPELSVALSANPNPSNTEQEVTLTAEVEGSEIGDINYSFWWNCSDPATSVSDAIAVCGNPVSPSVGAKFDGVSDTAQTAPHTYSDRGDYVAKVIVERGDAPPAEDRIDISIESNELFIESCSVSEDLVQLNDDVTWSAIVEGGRPSYTFDWEGDAPLNQAQYNGVNKNPVTVQYGSDGTKTGSVTVTDGLGANTSATCGSVEVAPTSMLFRANPAVINPGERSQLEWLLTGYSQGRDSCVIKNDTGTIIHTLSGGERKDENDWDNAESFRVTPTQTTTYTLTCRDDATGNTFSKSATVNLAKAPKFQEIKPE